MTPISLIINGKKRTFTADPQMPLLWAVRDVVGLKGSKFGCGIGQCGACTMHVDGKAVRTCILPVTEAVGKKITTIEGVGTEAHLHPVQQAWIAEQVPQCGYCQTGQIMSAVALLKNKPNPTDADIDTAMSGNICRCGTYPRIRKAIHTASGLMHDTSTTRKA